MSVDRVDACHGCRRCSSLALDVPVGAGGAVGAGGGVSVRAYAHDTVMHAIIDINITRHQHADKE